MGERTRQKYYHFGKSSSMYQTVRKSRKCSNRANFEKICYLRCLCQLKHVCVGCLLLNTILIFGNVICGIFFLIEFEFVSCNQKFYYFAMPQMIFHIFSKRRFSLSPANPLVGCYRLYYRRRFGGGAGYPPRSQNYYHGDGATRVSQISKGRQTCSMG